MVSGICSGVVGCASSAELDQLQRGAVLLVALLAQGLEITDVDLLQPVEGAQKDIMALAVVGQMGRREVGDNRLQQDAGDQDPCRDRRVDAMCRCRFSPWMPR